MDQHRLIVVAAVDGSEHTDSVIREAVRFARLLEAELHVVHVVHLTGFYYSALASALIDENELEQKLLDAVWRKVDPLIAEADGVKVTKVGLSGYAGDVIADYADDVDAELLTIGSRGWGAVKAAVLGSTSQRVLHKTERNVLVVSR